MDPMMAQIIMFAGNFAPRGWAFCEGQLLPISSYSALFSLLGTTYGGDGRTTFALPDFRGRAPLQPGNGPGLSHIAAGQKGGAEVHALTQAEMPAHNHDGSTLNGTVGCNEEDGDSEDPQGRSIGLSASDTPYNSQPNDKAMKANDITMSGTTGNAGGSQPFSVRNPYIGCNYIIALQGVYPSRS